MTARPKPPGSATRWGRRQWLQATSACLFAAPSAARANRGPAEQITVGVIGLGSRGFNLIDSLLPRPECRIVALCDVDQHHYRDRPWGKGKAFGRDPAAQHVRDATAGQRAGTGTGGLRVTGDYRSLVEAPGIDALVVATPDHWHARITLDALDNGKDVYCEKPVTHLFAEGQLVTRRAARRQAVFQTGSQQRSAFEFRRAVELVRNGLLGDVWNLTIGLPPGYDQPQGEAQVTSPPKTLDYDFWCGPAPRLPYMRARHHRWWRGHRAFGGGVLMDWIGHHNDIAHWAIGVERSGPTRVEAVDWVAPQTDIYNSPHHYTIRCEYAGGIRSTISSRAPGGLRIDGTDGWLHVNRGRLTTSDPRWAEREFHPGSVVVRRSDDHVGDFLDCVRDRRECIAPADIAHRSITPGHIGYVARQFGRPLSWDPTTETFPDDREAERLLMQVEYRDGWNQPD